MAEPSSVQRCSWVHVRNPLYVHYHDEEWGRPLYDDAKLFEMFLLETFQAGLSWECVLNKRESFREALDGFDAQKIATYGDERIKTLLQNKSLIRSRAKMHAAVHNAQLFLDIQAEYGTFAEYLWSWTDGQTFHECGRTTSPLSDALSKDFHQRGMTFVGSTTVYAFLQAVGVVNSHDSECFLGLAAKRNKDRAGNVLEDGCNLQKAVL